MANDIKQVKTKGYDHRSIEKKWREKWLTDDIYITPELHKAEQKFYSLYSFPYPSGAGLHVGHAEGMFANDIIARYYRMKGAKVTLPMGWDSFGLPAENYAIKTGIHPHDSTEEAIATFIDQIKKLGISVDWHKEVGAHRKNYYKWTQWFFTELYKYGLAYKGKASVNWCPKDQTVLANEQVIEGRCERCDTPIIQKEMEQWFFKITDYAERLVNDLENVDWPDATKIQQRNWIGRSAGINIEYEIENHDFKVVCFTTRPDTNFGATFIVVAPDGHFVKDHLENFPNRNEVGTYIQKTLEKTELERQQEGKKKTGVFTGLYAINKLNNKKLPVYIADFVLGSFGTGSVVGVPGHDLRDFQFAQAMGLDIVRVVIGPDGDKSEITDESQIQEEAGTMINSEFLNGMEILAAKEKIMDYMEEKGMGRKVVNYRLRDWLISRQRYWGAPIPVIWKERKKPDKTLIIHGYQGNGKGNWQPWLESELKAQKLEVSSPDFPDTNKPVLEDWLAEIEKVKLTKDSAIVGHSLGGFAALKYAETHKIKQLILVAPTNTGNPAYWKNQEKNYKKGEIEQLQKDFYKDLDFGAINENVEEIVFIFGMDDPYITKDIRTQFELQFPGADFKYLFNRHHMGSEAKATQLPELLQYFSKKQYKVLATQDLPLELPRDVDFIPKGYSPLSRSKEYIKFVQGKYGREWFPEFDTMDTFVCSSWYFFRFVDPSNNELFANSEELNKWLPVDLYMIGTEHIVLHLLYARFFTKFLYDIGKIKFNEPFAKMRHMGIILGPDGRKMSKRWGNVINPNDVVDEYGSDTLRMYEMFMGPLDQAKSWNESSVQGVRRFLQRIYEYNFKNEFQEHPDTQIAVNKLIKKIEFDILNLKYNTAVSEFMKFINEVELKGISLESWKKFLLVLAPFAPYLAEEMWHSLQEDQSVHMSRWPVFDQKLIETEKVEIAVQFKGKTRGSLMVERDISESEITQMVKNNSKLNTYIQNGYNKVIYVPGRIINYV